MDDLHDVVANKLRSIGQRYTDGRRRLIAALDGAPGPIGISGIAEVASDLPQSSIYRNLAVLEEVHCVRRLSGDDGVTLYELGEELSDHHHHLVCSSCGAVADFSVPSALERELDLAVADVARQARFKVESHRLDLVGLCSRCS